MGDGVASFFNQVRYWTTMGMSTQFSGELLAVAENRLMRALSLEPDAANTDEGRNDTMSSIQEKTSDEVKLPASQKVYIESAGGNSQLRVPFREISLSPSKDFDGTL